jgi:MurNAc alpha-1-phosphate uridylyltransferase
MVDNPAQHTEGDFTYQNGQLLATGIPKLTFSGVGVYQPSLFANIERGKAAKLAPILRAAIEQHLVSASHYQGVWHDIGTPQRLADLDQQLTARA